MLALAVDWDGTVTEVDTLHMVIERFGDLDVFHELEAKIGRQLTLQEVIREEMATITAPLEEVVAWLLDAVRLRPGLDELVTRHDALIVSAGFHELIEPVLEREGIAARLVANRITTAGPEGWEASFGFHEPCVVCGEPCKRAAVADLGPFAYVGDGVSDRCVSLAAERVFARDGLARWLGRSGVTYESFETLTDVAVALSSGQTDLSRPRGGKRSAGDG